MRFRQILPLRAENGDGGPFDASNLSPHPETATAGTSPHDSFKMDTVTLLPTGRSVVTSEASINGARHTSNTKEDTWFTEVLASLISLASLIAMAILLMAYNNKASPSLPHNISLNGILQVLSTTSRTSLLFAVAAALGQHRWSWFQSRRSLVDMELIDGASRGPFGSIKMLCKRAALLGSMGALGALVIILSPAFDPFVQLAVTYPIQLVRSQTVSAWTKQAYYFPLWDMNSLNAVDDAVVIGILSGGFGRQPWCPSANCTWSPFESVAMCSKCSDITSKTTIAIGGIDLTEENYQIGETKNSTYNITIEGTPYTYDANLSVTRQPTAFYNGNSTLSISLQNVMVWSTYWARQFGDTVNVSRRYALDDEIPQPLIAFAQVELNPDFQTTASTIPVDSAQQCIISPCVRTYTVGVKNNEVSTTILSERFLTYYLDEQLQADCFTGSNLTAEALRKRLTKANDFWASPSDFAFCYPQYTYWPDSPLADSLTGYVNITYFATTESGQNFTGEMSSTSNKYLEHLMQYGGLPNILPNVSASLTKAILDSTDTTALGDALVPQVFVQVRWAWLTLPFVLVAASVVFLGITMVTTRQRHGRRLWKNSALAMLYGFELDKALSTKAGTFRHAAEMTEAAESTHVRLDSSFEDGSEKLRLKVVD